jgi:hypothetical protein
VRYLLASKRADEFPSLKGIELVLMGREELISYDLLYEFGCPLYDHSRLAGGDIIIGSREELETPSWDTPVEMRLGVRISM